MNENFFGKHTSWESASCAWDQGAKSAALKTPLKRLKTLPQMPGIAEDNLKWKSFKYMLFHREGKHILKHMLAHPLRYTLAYFKSLFKKKSYIRKEDFFYYNLKSNEDFLTKAKDALVIVGFSYCQKPFECPSGRFTPECIRDPENTVCRQCDIGKAIHALPQENMIPLLIPTVHYIGRKIFEIVHANPKRRVMFLITACEMTLEMFGDWGNMVGIEGIGIRLDGRICNTMKAFELSEEGIKPGLTVLTNPTFDKLLGIIRSMRSLAT
jgi:hypothetical protein